MSTPQITTSTEETTRENGIGGDGRAADPGSAFFQEPGKSVQVQSFQKDGEEKLATPKKTVVSNPQIFPLFVETQILTNEGLELMRLVDEIKSRKKLSDASCIDLVYKRLQIVTEMLDKVYSDLEKCCSKLILGKICMVLCEELDNERMREGSEINGFSEVLYKKDESFTFKHEKSMSAVTKKEEAHDVCAMLHHQTQILDELLASVNMKKFGLTLDQEDEIIAFLKKAMPLILNKGRAEIEIEIEKLKLEKKCQEAGNNKGITIDEVEMKVRKAHGLKVSWLTLATLVVSTGTAVAVTTAFCFLRNKTN